MIGLLESVLSNVPAFSCTERAGLWRNIGLTAVISTSCCRETLLFLSVLTLSSPSSSLSELLNSVSPK